MMASIQSTGSGRIVVAVLIAALIATIVVFGLMQRPEGTMSEAGYGIIPYEFAFTADRAQVIQDAWSTEGRDAARRSILIDFALVPCYVLLFGSVAALAVHDAVVAPLSTKCRACMPADRAAATLRAVSSMNRHLWGSTRSFRRSRS